MKHEILEEVWHARDQIAAECGHDVRRLAERMHKVESQMTERLVLAPEPKKTPNPVPRRATHRRRLVAA